MRDATWNSTTGRMPARAAPLANPVKAASEIGMSITRSGANASSSPAVLRAHAAPDVLRR